MIAAIENEILARLKDAEPQLPWAWKMLETYPADWDAWLKENRSQARAPGGWVGMAGLRKVTLLTSGLLDIEAVFGLTLLAINQRGEEERRHGLESAGEIGSYQLMIAALQILAGWCPPSATEQISVGRVQHVRPSDALRSMKASMISAELFVRFEAPVFPIDLVEAEEPTPFEIFHANWDVRPFGGIDANAGEPGIQLPDDAHADATDHVELPQ